jgi:hypothetical protein
LHEPFSDADIMTRQPAARRIAPFLALASLLTASIPTVAGAQHAGHAAGATIPSSIREEHHEVQSELGRATKLAGRTGVAARALASVLQPHFEREEQIALPPLSMLAPLARGERVATPAWLLPMTDSLRRELPQMLREHVAIRAATQRLAEAARAEGQTAAVRLTEKLALHARSEEEVLYPAAILVGDLVRARAPRR